MSNDLINRREALYELAKFVPYAIYDESTASYTNGLKDAYTLIGQLPSVDRPNEWIPCGERLPEKDDDYLVCPSTSVLEDYSEFGEVMIIPHYTDCEAFGWWVDRYDPISLGFVDSDFNEFEVVAWRPLPEPWKGGR